ncbi:hypothetical protein [Sphingobium ummariense]|uniref:Uncharacterized protein n=1 Tax=Sphingobium ummariense RL-3 TaxID=1346791 RepID=T0J4Z1_9SPHN|nr:hypothetical protein [Sphingobium ummariense]EQB31902.1 hypothetical protein M529_12135 [Sphingobium ummariense RL-3]
MKSAIACSVAILCTVAQPTTAQTAAPLPVAPTPEAGSAAMTLPANTEVMLRMNSDLSSKTAREGTMFDLSVATPVMVEGFVVIPMNARAVGEVTWLTGKGAFGKSGKMNIELRYIEVAGRRIPVKGSYRQEGEGNTAATIGGVIAAGVFAGFITGKTAVIPAGRELKAFTQNDIALAPPRRPAPMMVQPAPMQASYTPSPAAPKPASPPPRASMVDHSLEINLK